MTSPILKRITTKTTTTAISTSCYLEQVIISCSNAGTGWTLAIQDKTSPNPFIWIGPFTLTVPTDGKAILQKFDLPIPMTGGIDIVTGGTTAGEVAVCLIIGQ